LFIELIDLLRCPREHEETWMVAAFNKMNGRFIVEGKLGCPVCHANFPIADGIPDLRSDPYFVALVDSPPRQVNPEESERLAAFLNLTREGAVILLAGEHADSARGVAELTMSRAFAIRPHPVFAHDDSELVATLLADTRLPFATSSIDGIAIDSEKFSMSEITRVLKPGGRFVAPSSTKLAGNIRELARDEDFVVAEAVGPLLNLRR
jgi:uncharacterized protein YbaR (Trm112 family)